MIYWLLLLIIAFVSYLAGSLSTIILASNFVFRTNLRKLGRDSIFISNFRRIYGVKGWIKLLLTELFRDLLPILFGGLLFGLKGFPEIGRIFAAFCLIMGRLYPVEYEFKGSHAIPMLIIAGLFCDISVGISILLVSVGVLLLTKYFTFASVAGAITGFAVSVLVVDNTMIVKLMAIIAAIVVFKHIPSIIRILNGKETKLTLEDDISYKFDQKF